MVSAGSKSLLETQCEGLGPAGEPLRQEMRFNKGPSSPSDPDAHDIYGGLNQTTGSQLAFPWESPWGLKNIDTWIPAPEFQFNWSGEQSEDWGFSKLE